MCTGYIFKVVSADATNTFISVGLSLEAVDEAGFDGGFDEFGGVFYLKFLHQVETVVFYGALAEEEDVGYIGIGEPFDDVF